MFRPISSDDEVKAVLGTLKETRFAEREADHFHDLVWSKIELMPSHAPFYLSPAPVFGILIAVLALSYGWWISHPKMNVPEPKAADLQSVSLSGMLVKKGGTLTEQEGVYFQEGDRKSTASDSRLTFYFPGAGYIHVAGQSEIKLTRARKENSSGRVRFEFELMEGQIYSALRELKGGSTFQFKSPYGTARVIGTDFLIELKKDEGMLVEVAKGTVDVSANSVSGETASVREGSRALITSGADGKLSISAMDMESQMKLSEELNRIFGDELTAGASSAGPQVPGQHIQIRLRQEVKS